MNITTIARQLYFNRIVKASQAYATIAGIEKVQRGVLCALVRKGGKTLWGQEHNLTAVGSYEDFAREHRDVSGYSTFRPYVMRMVAGERDILWPGITRNFAQSSGTSDGKSKYIPITADSLKLNHYRGGAATVGHYLNQYPDSRIFSGRSFILGGSFANELSLPRGVRVGDLSANLIANINPLVNLLRIPSMDVALMEDWTEKLPALVEASINQNVTNISGVPSWFMTVIREVIGRAGATTIHDVWPNLEVFFHGGISMAPYREQYRRLTNPERMRYIETYNASEGFFAVQASRDSTSMLLLLDAGVFYEFIPVEEIENEDAQPVPAWKVERGRVYSLVITSCNGLWRYTIGDTVKIENTAPLEISIAGRTKHFINAFGEELMVYNTDRAIAAVMAATGCEIANYTVAPLYATGKTRGRHQWLVEFVVPPADIARFASLLDAELRRLNSDYDAKRAGNIFLDPPEVVVAPEGLFDRWLALSGRLGGQRKVPRLSNDRHIIEQMLKLID